MNRYAVLGAPIAHSLSPRIFERFAALSGVALSYEALATTPQTLKATLLRLSQEGYQGLNLTSPLKEAAFPLVDAHSQTAAQAQAINMLTLDSAGRFFGGQ